MSLHTSPVVASIHFCPDKCGKLEAWHSWGFYLTHKSLMTTTITVLQEKKLNRYEPNSSTTENCGGSVEPKLETGRKFEKMAELSEENLLEFMRNHQRVSVTSLRHRVPSCRIHLSVWPFLFLFMKTFDRELRPLVDVLLNFHSNAKDTWKYKGQGSVFMCTLTINGPQESSVTKSRTSMDLHFAALSHGCFPRFESGGFWVKHC